MFAGASSGSSADPGGGDEGGVPHLFAQVRVGYRLDVTHDPNRRRVQIRPLGGAPGCLAMILFSILASVVLTVLLNLVF